ncbi:kinase inhibitor [Salimicrobium jeotgali]|uniref:Allophanate hydrolase subunit 1 n=2 Tax=Salimicrobium jeotgali TaxID=1230341 RepID=K2H9Y7_9BACI|nr:5-oxoprolinase subunit PxpB [Salimicrobium jeotgali]AKG05174.1 kinase inhibitor [Salimicrobium jeotgali]EKE32450.1 allophanate hydrolase subunit 1 [Salimicrobium jeotgali]MBM7695568.1 inhibitor of KinA [Salimicrobium jeotgali]
MKHTIEPLGDESLFINLGDEIDPDTHESVQAVAARLEKEKWSWLSEIVPSYTGLAVYYDAPAFYPEHSSPYEQVAEMLKKVVETTEPREGSGHRTVEIPVCYGGEFGPDISVVAGENGLTEEEVIKRHSDNEYLVYMLGFAPGFPFLGGMDERIATSRKDSPRTSLPAGSVGIAGSQTGVYPVVSPGGWQLIGRTPFKLFNPDRESPSYVQPGDRVKFYPVSPEEYNRLEGEE